MRCKGQTVRGQTVRHTREAKYTRLLELVKSAKTKIKKSPADYRRMKRYDIVNSSSGERLAMALTPGQKRPQILVRLKEIYDIIRNYHLRMNHAGRTRLMYEIKQKYKNITAAVVMLYLSLCEGCKDKVARRSKIIISNETRETEEVSKADTEKSVKIQPRIDPLSSRDVISRDITNCDTNFDEDEKVYPELHSRGQMDILDVTASKGESYKYLMVYRDLVTKYIHLKPLTSINVDETVEALLEIFLIFGAPNVLQSKNGMSVTKQICRRMYTAFPDLKVVSGEQKHASYKGQNNQDILRMLSDWLKENSSMKWYQGVKYVQYVLNTTFNMNLHRTPSEAVFGYNPKRGVATFMTKNEYDHLHNETDLKQALEEKESGKNSEELMLEESLIPSCSFIKFEPDDSFNTGLDDETMNDSESE
ncbi:KRAB-A domain-containing protein 2 isoform X1 [Bicyclus anynana]|uniref:KRAB-A domain-containing protein 2 isoform X1 n=1 Tax=Bicyclus anynana TaxID=110368 RepID=A0ABM3LH26_BICAN|nr:KRAB-A domain-containing protein 2 isoform X1 [Bicyclus anynana]